MKRICSMTLVLLFFASLSIKSQVPDSSRVVYFLSNGWGLLRSVVDLDTTCRPSFSSETYTEGNGSMFFPVKGKPYENGGWNIGMQWIFYFPHPIKTPQEILIDAKLREEDDDVVRHGVEAVSLWIDQYVDDGWSYRNTGFLFFNPLQPEFPPVSWDGWKTQKAEGVDHATFDSLHAMGFFVDFYLYDSLALVPEEIDFGFYLDNLRFVYADTVIVIDSFEENITNIDNQNLPEIFSLNQNYPNPFNPSTTIEYSLPSIQHVQLGIYDILGNEIAVLVDQTQAPGRYTTSFNGSSLPSGIYFYTLKTEQFQKTRKMVFVK